MLTKADWKRIAEATGFIARFQDSVVPAMIIVVAMVLVIASFPLIGWMFGPGALMLAVLVASGAGLLVHAAWSLFEIWTSGMDDDDDDEDDGSGDDLGPPSAHIGEPALVH